MSKERQILDFIFDANTKPLTKGLSRAENRVSQFGEAVDKAFSVSQQAKKDGRSVAEQIRELEEGGEKVSGFQKQLAESSPRTLKTFLAFSAAAVASYKALNFVIGEGVELWKDHFLRVNEFRREIGMTEEETRAFSLEIVRGTAQYGVALSKVQSTAFFLSKGTSRARGEVAALAAEIENFKDITGTTGDEAVRLSRMLTERLGLSYDNMTKSLFAFKKVAQSSNIPADEILEALAGREDLIRIRGADNASETTAAIASIVAGMREAGAETEHVNEILDSLADNSTKLGSLFLGAEGNLQRVVDQVRSQLPESTDMISEVALQNIAKNLGASATAIEMFSKAGGLFDDKQGIFTANMGRSASDLKAEFEAALDPVKKLERAWGRLSTSISATLTDTIIPVFTFWIEKVNEVIEGWRTLFGLMDEERVFVPGTQEEKRVQATSQQMFSMNKQLAKGEISFQTYKRMVDERGLSQQPGVIKQDPKVLKEGQLPVGIGGDKFFDVYKGKTTEQIDVSKQTLQVLKQILYTTQGSAGAAMLAAEMSGGSVASILGGGNR